MTKVATGSRKRRPNPNRGSKPGERRGGRQKGTPNKVSRDVKGMILEALHGAGGVKYLQTQADKNPTAFMTLVGKVLPLAVSNPDGTALSAPQFIINPVRAVHDD